MCAMTLEDLAVLVRCPDTGRRLRAEGTRLLTEDGGVAYPVVDGVPVLLHPARSPFAGASLGSRSGVEASRKSAVAARLASLRSRNLAAGRGYRLLAELLHERGGASGRPRVLVLGGRVAGQGMSPLLEDPGLELVETDIALGPRTQIVCDAHDLPFADGTFDAVVAQAVLEHVLDPPRVAAEVRRVLAHGGLVLSDVPFMQQVHEGAYDFTRFTASGHRRLWRHFEEVESGISCGPGMALAWSLTSFARVVAGDSRAARALASVFGALCGAVLCPLDPILVRRDAAFDAASATWFLGRRHEGPPTSDREILAGYRGAGPRAGWIVAG
jgi:SAM-dependent methyltransferase